MANTALISVICADHAGLIADVTGRLYELGVNLGDTTFAVLGGGAEFTLVAKLPTTMTLAEVERDLAGLHTLKDAKLTVHPFQYRESHDDSATITHRIEISGDDSPGLIARLSEVSRQYGVNIVRLNSESAPSNSGARFVLRMAVYIPQDKAASCMAAVANTAGQMHLKCQWQQVS
jgi:glycine cleavage system transcriptional repressor